MSLETHPFGRFSRCALTTLFVLAAGYVPAAAAQKLMPDGFEEVLGAAEKAFNQMGTMSEKLKGTVASSTALVKGESSSPESAFQDLKEAVDDHKDRVRGYQHR